MELEVKYVFDDSESRIRGLQHRRLPKGSCALFVYPSPALPKFHMRDVPTNLWLSSVVEGECVESYLMRSKSTRVYPLMGKTCCVVESRDEIPVGSKVDVAGDRLVVS